MYKGERVAVVVPAYNEEGFVGEVIDTMPDFVDTTFVVDDHSTDGTWEEIKAHARDAPADSVPPRPDGDGSILSADGSGADVRTWLGDAESSLAAREAERAEHPKSVLEGEVVPIRTPENRGRGNAVKTGYRLALLTEHDVVAVMDGDGQMDPGALHELLDPVVEGDADYAKGNRLVSVDHCEGMSKWRLFGNALLTALTKVASGQYHVRDPQNGYTAISAEALSAVPLDDVYDRYGFLNDFLIRLSERGFRIVDVPMRAVYSDEESGIRYKTFVPNLSLLLLEGFLRRVWVQYAKTWRDRPGRGRNVE